MTPASPQTDAIPFEGDQPMSCRGLPLVPDIHAGVYLTVESYPKWYDLYVVDPECQVSWTLSSWKGLTEEQRRVLAIEEGYSWCDHCVVPKQYAKLALMANVRPVEQVYNMIVGRFLDDILEGKCDQLQAYLDTECEYW